MNKTRILKIIMPFILSAMLITGCSSKKDTNIPIQSADDIIVNAQKAVENKDFNKAIMDYKKALNLSPKDVDIKLKLADIYFNIQQYSKSEEFLINALKINSDRLDIYDKLVKTYSKMGYDISYLMESCNKNSIHISDKTTQKLIDKFDILKDENKGKSNKEYFKQEQIVTIQATSIRNMPRLHDSHVIKTVETGTKLLKLSNEKVYDVSPDGDSRYWYNVKTQDGICGWVSEKALNGTNRDTKNNNNDSFNRGLLNRIYYLSQDSNIRSTPNYYEDGRNILSSAKKGARIIELNPVWTYEQDPLTGRDRCWIYVKLPNSSMGWISKRALDMTNR